MQNNSFQVVFSLSLSRVYLALSLFSPHSTFISFCSSQMSQIPNSHFIVTILQPGSSVHGTTLYVS